MSIARTLSGCLVLVAVAGCQTAEPHAPSSPGPASRPMGLRDVARGSCALEARAHRVVRDPGAWASTWDQLQGRADASANRPAVDFDREIVVVMSQGPKPSGGFGIEITRIEDDGSALCVHATETYPGPACMVTLALTHPYHAVAIPRTPRPIRFPRTPDAPPEAAERPGRGPYAGRINPDIEPLLASRERVRVLVTLLDPGSDEAARKARLDAVLADLGDDFTVLSRLDFAAACSGRITRTGLARLADDERVKTVDPECDGGITVELGPCIAEDR